MRNKIPVFCMKYFTLLFIWFFFFSAQAKADTGLDFSLSGHSGIYKPPGVSYLGTSAGGILNFGFVAPSNDFHVRGAGVQLAYQWANDIVLTTSASYGGGDITQDYPLLTFGGETLLIPGTGTGAFGEGFSLVGPLNQVTGASYRGEYEYQDFEISIGRMMHLERLPLNIKPYAGLEYFQSETQNRFSGTVPIFVRQFAYETQMKVHSLTPKIGLSGKYALNPQVFVTGGIYYGLNLNRGSGYDRLFFTGFGTQEVNMNNDDITHSHGARLGLTIQPSVRWDFSIEGRYDSIGNAPSLNTRTGTGLSDFSYESADMLSASVRLTYHF
jgi:hypothetical protein